MSETTTPEPEWLTSLRSAIHDAADEGRVRSQEAIDIAGCLLAEKDRRITDLEGTLDAVMKQRDNYQEMADRLACAIAPQSVIGEHSSANDPWENALRLAITVGNAMERERTSGAAPARLVREVPASEAREGDVWTLTAEVRETYPRGSIAIKGRDGYLHAIPGEVVREGDFSRPVSPLPDQPGAVIRATSCMFEGVRVLERLGKVKYSAGCWAVPGEAGFWDGGDLDLIEVLYLPAGAGVPEGGKA